jgi:hypothetical protein
MSGMEQVKTAVGENNFAALIADGITNRFQICRGFYFLPGPHLFAAARSIAELIPSMTLSISAELA